LRVRAGDRRVGRGRRARRKSDRSAAVLAPFRFRKSPV
jgi:hypothetical protein